MDQKRAINIKPIGNSQGLIIPKNILKDMGINDYKNQKLTLEVNNHSLIIKKDNSSSRLMDEFGYLQNEKKPENNELDWGQSVGSEKF